MDTEERGTGGIDHPEVAAQPLLAANGEEEQIGDPRVVAAIERLADLEGLPVAEQVAIFADVHARLTEALGTEAPGTEAPGTEAPGTEAPGAPAGQAAADGAST